jgi:hypothetical protein
MIDRGFTVYGMYEVTSLHKYIHVHKTGMLFAPYPKKGKPTVAQPRVPVIWLRVDVCVSCRLTLCALFLPTPDT